MKITLIRQDSESGKEALSICEAGTLFNKMKTETKSGHITALRNLIPMLEGTYSQYEHIDKLPYIYSAVEYTRTKEGERKMKQYNGLVQLEVKRLAGPSEMEYVKRQAALLPQTFAAFCGSSGRSVKIWVRFALPDDRGLPEKEAEAELFHAHAYWLAVKCYQPMLPYDINLQAPVLTQKCRMTLDESPYYNPDAVPFCLEQPLAMPGEETFRQRKQGEKNLLLRLQPGYESAKTFTKIYEAALNTLPSIVSKRVSPKKKRSGRHSFITIGKRMSGLYARRFIIFIRNVRVLVRKTVSEGSRRRLFCWKNL
mgnify:CR=1 FL=1